MKKTYVYDGPINYFDKCVDKRYFAVTVASSEKGAKNNIAFRYKMDNGYDRRSRINLPGQIKVVS